MPLHVGKGRNISTAISDIIDYVENPQKTDFGKFIYGYECDTRLADAEFLLSKRQYANLTGRNQGADDVIAYHLRQAFKPGEVTPEEANQIGRELALKLTKGNHAFVVCTHVDKHHVHNAVLVEGKLYKKNEVVKIIRTDIEGIASTSADLLPYGKFRMNNEKSRNAGTGIFRSLFFLRP